MPLAAATSATYAGLPGPGLRRSLWEHYVNLLVDGTPSDRVLVLLDGSSRMAWRAWLRGLSPGEGAAVAPAVMGGQIDHTPSSFIQQELRLWWAVVVQGLKRLGAPVAEGRPPLFVAIDLAQYMLVLLTRHRRGEGGLLQEATSMPHYQNVQLLDALGRSIEHGLGLTSDGDVPLQSAVDHRGKRVEGPCFGLARAIAERLIRGGHDRALITEAAEAIALYVHGMLEAGALDHALQLELYATLLWPSPLYQASLAARFDHVLVETVDELPPRWHAMLRDWVEAGRAACFSIQRDPAEQPGFAGGLREYVGADPHGAWTLASSLTRVVPAASDPRPAPFTGLGRALLRELSQPMGPGGRPEQLGLDRACYELSLDHYAAMEMLQAATERVLGLLQEGVAERHIALVAPTLSPNMIWYLRDRLGQDTPLYVFAGTNRLRDYRPVRVLITLAKLAFEHWGVLATRAELSELVELATGLNPLKVQKLARQLFPDHQLADAALVHASLPELPASAFKRYSTLVMLVETYRAQCAACLDDQARDALLPAFFEDVFGRVYARARAPRPGAEENDPADEAFMREVSQIGQLVELSRRFQALDARVEHDEAGWARRFLAFLDESPIAERPFFQREPHENAIMLVTPSQLAERGFTGVDETLRVMIWLDVGSAGWLKRDRRELTNARVLALGYPGGPYGKEREDLDMNTKLGRVLLACCLKAQERLLIYGCLTDEEGGQNDGDLPLLLNGLLAERRA